MLFDHLEEKEAVKRAAMIEENGRRFYTLLAEKSKDPETKALFAKFANDELTHLREVENNFFPDAGFTEYVTEEELAIDEYLEKTGAGDIFTKRIDIDALVKLLDEPRRALIVALDTEKHSVEYFEELSQRCTTPEARDLYRQLMEEEQNHVAQIELLLSRESNP